MKKENISDNENEFDENMETQDVLQENEVSNKAFKEDEIDSEGNEIGALKTELEDKSKKCEEYFQMLQRKAAEFENYKKRTIKEKEGIYTDAVCDVVASFLPVIDNLERALKASAENSESSQLKEGIDMVYKQILDVLKGLKVEEIKSTGETFDPNLHNAVMHVEDEEYGDNAVVEEFQKGYVYKEKVIRHSMVKVAN